LNLDFFRVQVYASTTGNDLRVIILESYFGGIMQFYKHKIEKSISCSGEKLTGNPKETRSPGRSGDDSS